MHVSSVKEFNLKSNHGIKSKGGEKTNCVNYYLLRYINLNLLGILLFQTSFNLPKVFRLISKEKSGIGNNYTLV